jgi:sulfite reductase (NADPH) flavoprotein alpha-component
VARLLKGLNDEFGTDYGLFEYEGHDAPESVLIVFGTTESSLASQMSLSLNRDGNKVGVLRLRIYRPFLEEEFIKAIPKSVKTVGVLGQVCDALAVADSAIHSNLYGDVVLAMAFAKSWSTLPVIKEIKYPRGQVWAPNSIAAAFQLLSPKPLLRQGLGSSEAESWSDHQVADLAAVQEYTFWDLDESASVNAASVLGYCLSRDPSINISVKSTYDSMVQGGLRRTDIRKSKKSMDAAYPVEAADVIFVGDAIILQEADVLYGLKAGGSVVLKLSGVKDENLEKTLSSGFRKNLADKAARLFIYDPSPLVAVTNEQSLETYLTQLAFFRVSAPGSESFAAQKLAAINGSPQIFSDFLEDLAKVLHQVEVPEAWAVAEVDAGTPALPSNIDGSDVLPAERVEAESPNLLKDWKTVAKGLMFKEAFATSSSLRPDLTVKTHIVHVKENRRLTPLTYDRNIFHIEFDLGDSGLTYQIGEALGIHAQNDEKEVQDFIDYYKLEPDEIVEVPSREDPNILEHRTVYQALMQNVDIFGRPPKRFYESLAEFATDPKEKKDLLILGGLEGVNEFKRRAEVDTVTFADVLLEFSSAHPSFHDIIRIVDPMKRREYSIASCQKATPTSVALMIVTINWVDPKGRDRFGQATRYLNKLRPGAPVTVSIKPSVMKLPSKSTVPLIMAGLGTGLAPFRAFAQHRAWEKEQGLMIGPVLLYMGSRHQREEYCYGEEWEAYQAAGVITLLGRAFSRDQPHKIYIQDRMRETMNEIIDAYFGKEGSFYLCGPTWPVPDVQNVLEDAVVRNSRRTGKRVEPRKEIERLKDAGRYVLEVY